MRATWCCPSRRCAPSRAASRWTRQARWASPDFVDEWVSAPYPEQQSDRKVIFTGLEWVDAEAARHGLQVFAEHTPDARNRPGAHPNIDRLLAIADGGAALSIVTVENRN